MLIPCLPPPWGSARLPHSLIPGHRKAPTALGVCPALPSLIPGHWKPPGWERAPQLKNQRVGTCSNMMSLLWLCGLYPGWGMGLSTGTRCCVPSSVLTLWAPRMTFIWLQREENLEVGSEPRELWSAIQVK